jgi:hypothetical protein
MTKRKIEAYEGSGNAFRSWFAQSLDIEIVMRTYRKAGEQGRITFKAVRRSETRTVTRRVLDTPYILRFRMIRGPIPTVHGVVFVVFVLALV